jgi:hypothetical protein
MKIWSSDTTDIVASWLQARASQKPFADQAGAFQAKIASRCFKAI